MSLMEQARSPFALVDEINQGMDARAERLVHNQLVGVTCNSDVGQYFLITPKLLPNLDYHPRMKVLCVYNGEWLPEEADKGDLMGKLNGFLTKGRGRAEA
jgi:chromosome segregation ATPase